MSEKEYELGSNNVIPNIKINNNNENEANTFSSNVSKAENQDVATNISFHNLKNVTNSLNISASNESLSETLSTDINEEELSGIPRGWSFLDRKEERTSKITNLSPALTKENDKPSEFSVSDYEIAHYPFKNYREIKEDTSFNEDINNYSEITRDINNIIVQDDAHCKIEINILEKHCKKCPKNKRLEKLNGNYQVLGRMVYQVCSSQTFSSAFQEELIGSIKNSPKSFRLSDPKYFRKDLKEVRSRITSKPILPNYKCVINPSYEKNESTEDETSTGSFSKNISKYPEIYSVYIRTNKGMQANVEKVPGDSFEFEQAQLKRRQVLELENYFKLCKSPDTRLNTNSDKSISVINQVTHSRPHSDFRESKTNKTLQMVNNTKNETLQNLNCLNLNTNHNETNQSENEHTSLNESNNIKRNNRRFKISVLLCFKNKSVTRKRNT